MTMAILTSDTITVDIRRRSVRTLADITSVTMNDATLDEKIEPWDEVARTYFQVQGQTLDGSEAYFKNLITVSDLLTSIAIRQSIGGRDNIDVAKDQTTLFKSIVNSQNKKEMEQGANLIKKTAGTGYLSPRGEFA